MTNRSSKSAARAERQGRRARSRDDSSLLQALNADNAIRVKTQKRRELIMPLNEAQRRYDTAIHTADLVFGIGPAGTGKTWFAAARAAEALRAGEIERIIITRPAVESGEKLGFLPGELDEKFEPYFRPVRDALEETLGTGHLEYALRAGQIEARPLALLRGATLKNCWVLADEMQNATYSQLKMLLSRIGDGAKYVVNGDPRQMDIPRHTSGLARVVERLSPLAAVRVIRFNKEDIVRSGLCQQIVEALEDGEEEVEKDIPLPKGMLMVGEGH